MYVKANGLTGFINLMLSAINLIYNYFFLKPFFKSCGRINIRRPYYIHGHKNIEIGENFSSGVGLRLEAVLYYKGQRYNPIIKIGDNVIINDYVHIGATNRVIIGNNVLIGSKVLIIDHNHGDYFSDLQSSPSETPAERILTNDQEVIIEDNVWIGEHVCILPNTRIGFGSIIGAGAVVSRDIPPFSIAVGNPARVVKRYSKEENKWVKVEE